MIGIQYSKSGWGAEGQELRLLAINVSWPCFCFNLIGGL